MILIPAIDLKDGHCVRLEQGRMETATVFSEDPAHMAAQWTTRGARRLHVVDLNGAHQGKPRNAEAIKAIIVGLDAKDGKVATDGWSRLTKHDVIDLAKRFQDYGVEAVIYTDIGRDGMMTGVNIEATVRLAQALTVPVIASGGLNSLDDVRSLCAVEHEGITGAITGRAI